MPSPPRRFPPPWPVAELDEAFVVSDASGQALAYVYFRRDENAARQAKVLTWDEARRVAANIARLPELLQPRVVHDPMPDDPDALIAWGKHNITGEE